MIASFTPLRLSIRDSARGNPRQRGFALLELIIGTAVIATSLGAIVSLTVRQSKLRRADSELHLALTACRTTLESLRTMKLTDIEALNGTGFDALDLLGKAGGLRAVPGDADGLPGILIVTTDKTSGAVKLLHVVARVTWAGAAGRQRFEMKTLIGERK